MSGGRLGVKVDAGEAVGRGHRGKLAWQWTHRHGFRHSRYTHGTGIRINNDTGWKANDPTGSHALKQ